MIYIKEQYRKKNIFIKGNVNKEDLLKIKGVLEVNYNNLEYEVKIESKEAIQSVFKYVSKCEDVTKFVVEEPSLNEIFVSKVGESYEK